MKLYVHENHYLKGFRELPSQRLHGASRRVGHPRRKGGSVPPKIWPGGLSQWLVLTCILYGKQVI